MAEIVGQLGRYFVLQPSHANAFRIFNQDGNEVGVLQLWNEVYYLSFGCNILLKVTRCNLGSCIQTMLRPPVRLEEAYKQIQTCLASTDPSFTTRLCYGILPPDGVQARFDGAELELWVHGTYRCYTTMDQVTLDAILRRIRTTFFFEGVPEGQRRRTSRCAMMQFDVPTTTLKLDSFLSTPLREAKLASVPGIGAVTLSKLQSANISTVEQLMGQFMVLSSSVESMEQWLRSVCEVRSTEAKKISEALLAKYERVCVV